MGSLADSYRGSVLKFKWENIKIFKKNTAKHVIDSNVKGNNIISKLL